MAVSYKDINQLTQKSSVAGTEKLPVSDTEFITPAQMVAGVGSNLIQAMRVFALYLGEVDSTTTITSPEWSSVITDNDGNILAGVRVDGTVFIADI